MDTKTKRPPELMAYQSRASKELSEKFDKAVQAKLLKEFDEAAQMLGFQQARDGLLYCNS